MAAPTGASARRPAGAVSIDDLPPGVLGRIFALAGSAAEIGPSVTLVSHAWRSVLYTEPAIWSTFRLQRRTALGSAERHAAWLGAQLAPLRRVAPLVTALEVPYEQPLQAVAVSGGNPGFLEEAVSLLQPAALTSLCLSNWADMPPGQLARFPNLRMLSLWACSWEEAVLQTFRSMRQLTHLRIGVARPPPQLLSALAARLPQLQKLAVTSRQPLQHAEQLTRLTNLWSLDLTELTSRVEGCWLLLPPPARWPRLEQFFVSTSTQISRYQLPGAKAGLAIFCSNREMACVELSHIQHLTSLQALLEAMVSPAGGPVVSLVLCGELDGPPAAVALPAGSLAAAHLATLEELNLNHCPVNLDSSMEVLVQALLPCISQQLNCLVLRGGIGGQLPSCVAQRQGLRQLMLRSCDLASLPDGPYLQGLEHLDVGSNRLTTLPPALPATLTKLVLSYNRQLVLSDADVDRLLGLPRLAELSVRDTATSVAVLERLFAAPNLRIA